MTVLLRPVTEPDWSAIHPFFAAIVDAGESYAYPAGLAPEQSWALWTGDAERVVVAEHRGRVVGTARMGPNRPGRGAHVATASFMVDPSARGAGVGRALGEDVVRWAGERGYRAIQFNAVVETNTAAVALWRSLGFRVVGTVPEAFDSRSRGLVGLHVMWRPVP